MNQKWELIYGVFKSSVKHSEICIKKCNTAIILISHQERILSLADQIIVLAGGRIKEVTSKEKIMADISADTSDCMCGEHCGKGVDKYFRNRGGLGCADCCRMRYP